jgi:hypothetical protein
MNVFDRLKNTVDNLTGETLGSTNTAKKGKKNGFSIPGFSKKKTEEEELLYYDGITEHTNEYIYNEDEYNDDVSAFTPRENNDSHPVLELLNIPITRTADGLLTSTEVENVEFTLTSPTGLAVEEVSNFLFKIEQTLDAYVRLLNERNQDFIKLLAQCEKLEQEIISMKQENELSSLIGTRLKEEDRLRQEIVNLRLENEQLLSKLQALDATKQIFSSVKQKQETKKQPMSFPEIKKQPVEEKVVINQAKEEVKQNQDAFSNLMDELDF